MKKKVVPYGKSEFKDLIFGNYYYVDKTKFIPILESYSDYLFFIRPRRFGKTLFVSMLQYYYDIRYKDIFDDLFKDTWIHKNKTDKASSYQILRFNFSNVNAHQYKDSFPIQIEFSIDSFLKNYGMKIDFKAKSPLDKLSELFMESSGKLNIYCIIDEYDNFANELLSKNKREYEELVKGQESLYKQFFKILKSATDMEGGPIKRMFITGVTPMTMFDVTSGFNIGKFISNYEQLNTMLGFTKDEVKELFEYYDMEPDFELLDEWYGNYKFCVGESVSECEPVYNTDMILYYLSTYIETGRPPNEMADINIRTDYGKLKWLVYTEKKLNGNFKILEKVVQSEVVRTDRIEDMFSAFDLIKVRSFRSLLYYLGLLTVTESEIGVGLKVPNMTIKRIMCEYIERVLEESELLDIDVDEFKDYLAEFALNGDLEVFRFLADKIKESTGLRDYIRGEQTVKAINLAYLNLSRYYLAYSELEFNKGFCDIYLEPFDERVRYFGLIEVKYLSRDEDKSKVDDLISEARNQLFMYEKDKRVQKWIEKGKKLKKIILVYHGWELIKIENFEPVT